MWIVIIIGSIVAWAASEDPWAGISAASAGLAFVAWTQVGKLRVELKLAQNGADAASRELRRELESLSERLHTFERSSPGTPAEVPSAPTRSAPTTAKAASAAPVIAPEGDKARVAVAPPEAEPQPLAQPAPEIPERPATQKLPDMAAETAATAPLEDGRRSSEPAQEIVAETTRKQVPPREQSHTDVDAQQPDLEAKLRALLIGDNPVARVGVLVLLVGIALLLRLAAQHDMFPIEARLACVALFSVGIVVFGYRQRQERITFARLLQGAGIAALYMVVFFAYRRFELLPPTLAFGLLVSIALSSGVLAVLQDALALVFVGTVGGFAAPVLASSGSGNHVALFSYYLALNALVLGVAWFKDWRLLNLTGFIGTFGVGTAWGVLKYRPEQFATTEPFLIAFFAIYLAITFLTALRRPETVRQNLSSALMFGLPLVSIALQTALAAGRDWIVAVSAVVMGALYYALARLLVRRDLAAYRNIVDGYLALSVGLATLAVPYALDSSAMVSATWTLEGAGLYWVGIRSLRLRARFASVVVLCAGFVAALRDGVWSDPKTGTLALLNPSFLCAALLFAAVLFVCALAERNKRDLAQQESSLLQTLIPLSFVLFATAIGIEIEARVATHFRATGFLACFAITATGLTLFGRLMSLAAARCTGLSILPLGALFLAVARQRDLALWDRGGALAWPLLAICVFGVLHQQGEDRRLLVRFGHVLAPLLWGALVVLLAWDLVSVGVHLTSAWANAAVFASLALVIYMLQNGKGLTQSPFTVFGREHSMACQVWIALAVAFWIFTLSDPATPTPLPYIPVLNPIEVASIGMYLGLVLLARGFMRSASAATLKDWSGAVRLSLVAVAFAIINCTLARGIHHFARVPYALSDLWEADAFQVGLSILWSLIGVGGTLWASRKSSRGAWLFAGALLAVVVAKIFLVDLESLGQIARILSFLAVGLLLLVVGYVAPMPPKHAKVA